MNTVNKYGVEWAGPRRKASWKRRLGCWLWSLIWMVLVSLALWGLFAWATGRVTGLTGVTSLTMAKPAAVRLAGFGVPEWVAYGVVMTLVLGILARLAWGAMQEAFQIQEMEDGEGWGDKPVPFQIADPLEVGGNAIPPSEVMPSGLTRRDAALIVHACGCEVGLLRNLVRSAQKPLSEDDQAETLAVAEKRLGQLRVTLWELRAKFQGKDAPQSLEGRGDEVTGAAGPFMQAWAVAVETALGQIEREHECVGSGCGVCDALTSVDAAPISSSQGLPVSESLTEEASGKA